MVPIIATHMSVIYLQEQMQKLEAMSPAARVLYNAKCDKKKWLSRGKSCQSQFHEVKKKVDLKVTQFDNLFATARGNWMPKDRLNMMTKTLKSLKDA